MNTTSKKAKKYLILENIRSVHNAGAIFRTADAVGIDRIILVGCTPAPIDRFGRTRADFHKAALGAEVNVLWEQRKESDASEAILNLQKEGFFVVCLEQSKNSIDYKKCPKKVSGKDVAVVVGNEVGGIEKKTMEVANLIIEIPMKGKKESLNVSVATGILLYKLFD